MHNKRSSRTSGKLITAAIASVGLSALCPSRSPGELVVDLRANTLNGNVVADRKNLSINIGDTLTLNVVARISGSNTVQEVGNFDNVPPFTDTRNDESLRVLIGAFQSVGGVRGNFQGNAQANQGGGNTISAFSSMGASNGTATDFDNDGDLDLGTLGTDLTNMWVAFTSQARAATVGLRTASPQTRFGASIAARTGGLANFIEDTGGPNAAIPDTRILDAQKSELLLGELTWVCTSGRGASVLQFVPRASSDNGFTAAWGEDGDAFGQSTANASLTLGTPISLTIGSHDRVWNPGSTTWNTSNTNWLNGGSPVVYQDTDIANFTNSGAGVVTIAAGGVAPSAVHLNSSSAYTFQGGPIAGSCLVTLSGSGTTTFKSANTYTGPTTVTGGSTLVVDGGDNRLGAAGVGITLDGGTLRTVTNGLITTRNITIAAGGGIFDTNGLNSQTSGILTGTGAFIKRGAGTLLLLQSNGHTGLKTIEAGILQIGSGGTAGSIVGDVIDNANLTFYRSTDPQNPKTYTYAGQISGNGSMTKLGNAPLLLSGNNSYTGGTTLSEGSITVGNGTTGTMVGDIVTATGTTLTFAASGATIHQIGAISGSGTTALSNGATVTADRVRQGTLQLTAATLKIRPNGTSAGVSRAALSVDSASRLDISDNKVVTSSPLGTLSSGSVYTGITGLIQSGRNGNAAPLWDGNGIVTSQSAATTSNLTSIGVARASDIIPASASTTVLWAGQTVTGTDTLVMYTYGGDANLDGKINIDDYVRIDRSFVLGLNGWSNGDFNYDGVVNIDDYTQVIDPNLINQGAPFSTGSGMGTGSLSGVTAIPEPSAALAALSGIFATGVLRRRRRRRPRE